MPVVAPPPAPAAEGGEAEDDDEAPGVALLPPPPGGNGPELRPDEATALAEPAGCKPAAALLAPGVPVLRALITLLVLPPPP